ncbi:carbon-nitrogen hydrolase family protein [Kitasatospora viridis]|uniref:Putative amidohydrolase n=1 Tax=Kitasatospora viridis TaxID=281105 RepID=A0A561TWL2_9ACTN|nr:carbon-nitrogen hydrolase family protein [Kitasatospora viridis]TWF91492.1 putative amidohydrolase [Kitasatospora viridis]
MTAHRNFKRQVRARAAKTGESYTAALRHFRPTPSPAAGAGRPAALRLAVAQTPVTEDPRDVDALRASGRQVRALMREASERGARLVQFPEGAICFPGKHVMSATGPETIGAADWDRYQWTAARAELAAIADLARELRLWTVIPSVHRLTGPSRPHNSMYVVSDEGAVATRYDERRLSKTKASFLYSPGRSPVVFEVDGVRFGCLLGMEIHYPELFAEYETLGVDCVLLSTTGVSPGNPAAQTLGHAANNSLWVSLSVPAEHSPTAPSGVAAPGGDWLDRCPADGSPAVTVVDLDDACEAAAIAVTLARPWRRESRSTVPDGPGPADPRSEDRTAGF